METVTIQVPVETAKQLIAALQMMQELLESSVVPTKAQPQVGNDPATDEAIMNEIAAADSRVQM